MQQVLQIPDTVEVSGRGPLISAKQQDMEIFWRRSQQIAQLCNEASLLLPLTFPTAAPQLPLHKLMHLLGWLCVANSVLASCTKASCSCSWATPDAFRAAPEWCSCMQPEVAASRLICLACQAGVPVCKQAHMLLSELRWTC